MSKWRLGLLAGLFVTPFLFLMCVGSYHLWETGWLFWAWWPMFLAFGSAYLLALRWTRKPGLLSQSDIPPPNYWTERDNLAWEKVTTKARSFERMTPELLSDPKHYSDLSVDLAQQIALIYNPGMVKPFDHLTIPEVLTCAELAAADLNELVQKYIPGVHMLRVRDYGRARQAAEWYKTGQNLYWAGAAIFNPLEVGVRWVASRYALGSILDRLQGNVLLWFHTAFVHQFGRYLVELNSGRLKVGVKRYRELIALHQPPPLPTDSPNEPVVPEPPPAGPKPISVAVLGPVKAGKSSLVNALLGKQEATVDTLPVAHVGIRYQVLLTDGQPLSVLDTAGYGQSGVNEAEFAAAAEAAREADIILFVTPATNPGRKTDIDLLDRLKAWFLDQPQLKMPPVVGVINQVDLLSPKAEWTPPYDWHSGSRPKEMSIRECVAAVAEQLAGRASTLVPVCGREGETWDVVEGLVPAIAAHLDSARGGAVLKAFHAEGNADQLKKLGGQLVEGGKQALKILLQNLKK